MRRAASRAVSASASELSRRKFVLTRNSVPTRESRNAIPPGDFSAPNQQILSNRTLGDARLDTFQEASCLAPKAASFAPADTVASSVTTGLRKPLLVAPFAARPVAPSSTGERKEKSSVAPLLAAGNEQLLRVTPFATSERREATAAVPFAARTYVSGSGRSAAPAAQPGSTASAPAGSPLASAASSARSSGPGSEQAGKARPGGLTKRGWSLLGKGGAGEKGGPKPLTHAESFSEFASKLRRARQVAQLTVLRGYSRGERDLVISGLKKQEMITMALVAYAADVNSADEHLYIPFRVRERIARETGSSTHEVDNLINKYEWFKEAAARIEAQEEQGKPVPRSFAEIERMMGGAWFSNNATARPGGRGGSGSAAAAGAAAGAAGSAATGVASEAPARNSPCPCGSGRRYKRCCGAAK
ncbi:hypothetical protein CLOP_g11859 [Closterium sp. NIES-67]|nr:hypothetical protein CLOP_g11859 [Closterium sp. NIES-67]